MDLNFDVVVDKELFQLHAEFYLEDQVYNIFEIQMNDQRVYINKM